ncbi:4-alpha-glucanotransferase [Shewanella sp. WXL01]|uniref:4-alpha-glucanotransferase n=1 Tax=Shewanella sp. WXL01 TaxID=2709721 RepID=UPI0014386396|nr:4-alpha-glucanotransferase [Shewanella sp. WXL01]NKF51068.1 4-alpha-glucanotransferase [Shewanella sp. WXL01]
MGLDKLLYLQGVGAEFVDCFGQHIRIPMQDRVGILKAMLSNERSSVDDAEECKSQFESHIVEARNHQLDVEPWFEQLPKFQFSHLDKPTLHMHLIEQDCQVQIKVHLESGSDFTFIYQTHAADIIGEYHYQGRHYCRYQVDVNAYIPETIALSSGYHQLTARVIEHDLFDQGSNNQAPNHQDVDGLDAGHLGCTGQWVLAPRYCYQAPVNDRAKLWGVSIQLYSLRSEQSDYGIGDFGALRQLIDYCADIGASFITLNPLHALDIAHPEHPSPYSPTDRRRLNPLYIDIAAVPEYSQVKSEVFQGVDNAQVGSVNLTLALGETIDYIQVFKRKYQQLLALYQQFASNLHDESFQRGQAFKHFKQQQGEALIQFCLNEVQQAPKWMNPTADFFAYLQFVANEQLALCQQRCRERGMAIGLVGDLAVGAVVHGCEVQSEQASFCVNASIGAPPDPFSASGQNWGLVPFDPVKMRQQKFTHFIALVRSNMRLYGALRIDHVMGLLRLWWWPLTKQHGHGAYVFYPVETLVAIICLESQRANCLIIGEDLGTVPPAIIDAMARSHMYSNELFYFSEHSEGFVPPAQQKRRSLMMLANHDVAPLKMWWQQQDLNLRQQLHLFETQAAETQAYAQRSTQQWQLLQWLANYGQEFIHKALVGKSAASVSELDARQLRQVLEFVADLKQWLHGDNSLSNVSGNDFSSSEGAHSRFHPEVFELNTDTLICAWIATAASGSANLFSVQLADLLDDNQCVNIPGTWKQYPNWQQRLPYTVSQIRQLAKVRQRTSLISLARAMSTSIEACSPIASGTIPDLDADEREAAPQINNSL